VADLVVCRAGATTIAELMRAGVPSVLIPYPHAAADHQTENAKSLAESGAAVLVRDQEAPQRLPAVVRELVCEPSRLHMMAGRARAQGSPRATELLADAVLRLAKV
jgi:UDP-N-acetylglucosamine--N-acetylmuramyl-(pentapeptide) pyrophosphoryl-undecaprenol N-acetylglucosamine transferase